MSQAGEGLLEFLLRARRLKALKRRGWALKLRHPNPESVAEHSFMVALISALLAEEEGLDPRAACLMGLLHDLHEAVLGDRVPGEPRAPGEEARALDEALFSLPPRSHRLLRDSWFSYYKGDDALARLVDEADALDMALQALAYEEEGYDRVLTGEFWESVKPRVRSPIGKRLLEGLIKKRDFRPR
jgi:putative hydrolase of HD superfamily